MHPQITLALHNSRQADLQRRLERQTAGDSVLRPSQDGGVRSLRRYFSHASEADEQPLRRQGR
jgi:hypothetical protein